MNDRKSDTAIVSEKSVKADGEKVCALYSCTGSVRIIDAYYSYWKKEVNEVYDPACDSGSLLSKATIILGKENVRQGFLEVVNNKTFVAFLKEIICTIYKQLTQFNLRIPFATNFI